MNRDVEDIDVFRYPNPHKNNLEFLLELSWKFLKEGSYGAARFYSGFVVDSIEATYTQIPPNWLPKYNCAWGIFDTCDKVIETKTAFFHSLEKFSNSEVIKNVLSDYSEDWILDSHLREFYNIPPGSAENFLFSGAFYEETDLDDEDDEIDD